jgi:hypothetical protein
VVLYGRRGFGALLAFFGLLAIVGLPSSARAAEFEIVPGSFTARMFDAQGNPENRAGSHPSRMDIRFALNVEGTSERDLVFELPSGLGGTPDAVPQCSRALFEAGEEDCPPESQVGRVNFVLKAGGNLELPVFLLEPAPGEFLSFASKAVLESPLKTELRSSDLGITLRAEELPKQAVTEGHVEFWGVPAEHQVGTTIPKRPMLTVPTRCGPLIFTFRTRSWEEGAPWLSASSDTGAPLEGCADLNFKPRLTMGFSNPVADSPTGMTMELTTPEEAEGSELADALVKDVTIDLPAGVTVSPAAAVGLATCSDAQLDVTSGSEAHCPAGSKVGALELSSPLTSAPLVGSVYLGEQRGSERLRLFVVAPGAGTVIKFVGALHVDPATGRFSTTLANLPQIPFRRLALSFDGGPRALLVSPLACGPVTATGRFVSYGGGPVVESPATVAIGSPIPGAHCPGAVPFAPRLVTHSSQTKIGHQTTLSVTLLRQTGEGVPRRFTLSLPTGLSAALGSVEACPDTGVAAGACPAGSRIGGVVARVGSGPEPMTLQGDAYVTGPYRRAPFGLMLQLHAGLGSLNLGAMSIRAAATVDGKTGRVSVATDNLPTEIEGIQVRFQAIELNIDRPGLVHNPTSCRPAAVDGTIESSGGDVVAVSSPLTLSGCHRLGFRPRFHIALEGRKELHLHGRPAMRISARMRSGDTSMRAMKMVLPRGMGFGFGGLEEICSRPDAAQGTCPAGARVGTAIAHTSLLSKPLKGAIYIVPPKAKDDLPDLGIALTALGTKLNISGHTEVDDGRLVTRLSGLPDMPLSDFTMRMDGGSDGAFSLDASPCKQGRPRQFGSTLTATGQDGAKRTSPVAVETNAHCR